MSDDFRLTVTHDYFRGFCRWLVHDEMFNAEQLLEVVEKPWKWTAEFLQWMEREHKLDKVAAAAGACR